MAWGGYNEDMSTPPEERFWKKVRKSDGCWEWTGGRHVDGHGQWRPSGRMNGPSVYTHRYAYEITHGPIPEGLKVCHRCDNPACVRPEHLFLGTQRDNLADMTQKGRRSRWTGRRKIRPHQVPVIKWLIASGFSTRAIAEAYGVDGKTIWAIGAGRSWKPLNPSP